MKNKKEAKINARISFGLSKVLKKEIEDYAYKYRIPVSELLRKAVKKYMGD